MGLLPALPGLQAAVAERPIMAASTFRATGIPVWDQAGQGAGPVVGRYTLMASSIPISLPINSGRRAPVLELPKIGPCEKLAPSELETKVNAPSIAPSQALMQGILLGIYFHR